MVVEVVVVVNGLVLWLRLLRLWCDGRLRLGYGRGEGSISCSSQKDKGAYCLMSDTPCNKYLVQQREESYSHTAVQSSS